MSEQSDNDPPLMFRIGLALTMLFLITSLITSQSVLNVPAQSSKGEVNTYLQDLNTLPVMQGNSLQAMSPTYLPGLSVLATRVAEIEETEITAYIRRVFGIHGNDAIAIAYCESGLNPSAVNWGDMKFAPYVPSVGLFQHHEGFVSSNWNDYRYSADLAYEKFLERDWKPWYNCAKELGLL